MMQTEIYITIASNPGIHFRGLLKKCNLAIGQLMYHIHQLEKKEKIIIERKDNYTRYFTRNVNEEDRVILGHLRSKTARELLVLLTKKKSRHSELVKHLNKSGSTISWYLNKLERDRILRSINKKYEPVNKKQVKTLLRAYKQSFVDKISDNFAEAWE